MKIGIIGQGYVGLTISAFAGEFFQVVGFDTNQHIVDQLNSGISHIEGVEGGVLKKWISEGRYQATTRGELIADVDIVIIAVPTPLSSKREPDLSYIDSACRTIGEHVRKPVLVINESTSFPGTLRNFIKPKIDKYSNFKNEHLYAISPERVDPGRSDFNQKNTPRLYSGLTDEASRKTFNFYSKFCDKLILVSTPEVAEAAKLFENTFRQVNIALVNQFARIAHALQIDTKEVLEAASSKPYGFMKFLPGAGVGGHCIPVDPTYLVAAAEKAGESPSFIHLANQVNLEMPRYIIDRIEIDFEGSLNGKSAVVVGVAYKPNVADTRETPATLIIENLESRGVKVVWHDPVVQNWNNQISCNLESYDICLVVTLHDVFDINQILNCSEYVFDCTGKIPGTNHL